jgi:SAM-dependent methyltransferase
MRLRRRGDAAIRSGSGSDHDAPFLWHLDLPSDENRPAAHSVFVRGWAAVPEGREVRSLAIDAAGIVPLLSEDRPDVRDRLPGYQVFGFCKLVPIDRAAAESEWRLVLDLDGEQLAAVLPIGQSAEDNAEFFRQKAKKLARVEELLRCPRVDEHSGQSCHGRLERDGLDALRCIECRHSYPSTERGFDFLTTELRAAAGIEDTENVSSWGYDPWAAEIIDQCPGLVLDNGSGLKGTYYDNVVNFEIVDYPTTDVLGVGEHLPFADATFDAVLSLVVLEHVRDPFRCASEITRVLKPGGRLYAAVPFLQPYHGYPHHYYNMTLRGLENLFTEQIEIERSGVPQYGLPIYTLTWFLNAYLEGLPPETAARFRDLRVSELLAPAEDYLDDAIVTAVDYDTSVQLACVNYVIGTKRQA